MKESKFSAANVYTFLCVFMPILSSYLSPIPGMELGTFAVLLCTPYLLVYCGKPKFRIPIALGIVMLYTVLCTLMALTGDEFYSTPNSIIMRTGRFLFLVSVLVAFGVPSLYQQDKYTAMLSRVTVIVAVYAIIQYLAYHLFGVELPHTFGSTKQAGGVFEDVVSIYRPASFLAEPSSAAYFMVPYLCYTLFGSKSNNNKNLRSAILISLGILCTTSGQGLIVLMVCWGVWIIKESKSFNIGRLFIVAAISAIAMSQIDLGFTINRMINDDGMNAVDARSEGYDIISTIPIKELVFGKGFGNYDEDVFFSSFASIIFCTGIVNMVLVGIMYIYFFFVGNFFTKMLVICSLILMVGGGVYTATYICLYYPLLIANAKHSFAT